jgi:predicted Rossmann-fold nucleotide-binding protein
MTLRNASVFCGSLPGKAASFAASARALGTMLADLGIGLSTGVPPSAS